MHSALLGGPPYFYDIFRDQPMIDKMSAIPPKADIANQGSDVRFVLQSVFELRLLVVDCARIGFPRFCLDSYQA